MSKLAGEQAFLLLKRSDDLRGHEIKAVATFDQALSEWDSTTRVSPVFPLNNSEFPAPGNTLPWFVFFIGPIDPGTLNLEDVDAFVSYGIHNLVLVTETPHDVGVCRILIELNNVPWEAWEVHGSRIHDIAYGPALKKGETASRIAVAKPPVPSQLKSASEEYRTLIAVTRAKCSRYLPAMVIDIDSFDAAFQRALDLPDRHAVAKLAWLANVNAALSRFSSQTFAGTSPILETECHFWTHSLLGIGTATQALVNIRRHHDSSIEVSRLAEKVNGLQYLRSDDETLTQRSFTDAAWQKHWLGEVTLPDEVKSERYAKLIAYFSGRDGYRSTSFTLSAPLELITGCNTYAWTPLTLTHELSHTLTSLFLSPLLDGVETADGSALLAKLCNPKDNFPPRTALDQARKTLVTAYVFLDLGQRERSSAKSSGPLTGTVVRALIERYQDEMVELITHLLDFQYFYKRDVRLYMTSIWESWDVIPNIQSRVDDYIVRTLVAVLSANQTTPAPLDATYEVVLGHLQELSANSPGGQYMSVAYERLRDNDSYFRDKLGWRVHIVKLVLGFFYDPSTNVLLSREIPSAGGSYSSFRIDELDEQQIRNPLSFLVRFASDRQPNAKKSLWMLHKLAFPEAS